jgi:hypothetical protein
MVKKPHGSKGKRSYNGEEMLLWLRVRMLVHPARRKNSFVHAVEKLR